LWKDPFYLQWSARLKASWYRSVYYRAGGHFGSAEKPWKGMLIGLLVRYLIYGFTFSYHISTHDLLPDAHAGAHRAWAWRPCSIS
jgi:hypothetical protein